MKKKVFIADAHPLTRKGLCHLLEELGDFEVCGEADGWHEALKAVRRLRPDVIVTELKLRDGSGWELVRRTTTDEAKVPVLILTYCDEKLFALRLLKEGARGYLMKDMPLQTIAEALRRVVAGHIAVSDAILSEMAGLLTHRNGTETADGANELNNLSNRELQVLTFLCHQKINKEIAECMGISEKTVSTYKTRLMEKINVRTTAELLARIKSIAEPAF